MRRLALSGFLLVAVLSGCGQAAPGVTQGASEPLTSLSRTGMQQASVLLGQDMMRRLDADNDGWVSQAEWTKAGMDANEFKKLDLSRQGRLGLNDLLRTQGFTDFRRKVSDVVTGLVGRLDGDKDGALSRAEFLQGVLQGAIDPARTGISMTSFNLADRNYDQKLVVSEVENMVAFSVVEAQLAAHTPTVPPSAPIASASNAVR